jgi:hypothetical protein
MMDSQIIIHRKRPQHDDVVAHSNINNLYMLIVLGPDYQRCWSLKMEMEVRNSYHAIEEMHVNVEDNVRLLMAVW